MKKLKQKHIQQFLQDIQDFQYGQKDKIMLQQHMTPPLLAAQLLFHLHLHQPLEDMVVGDIGTGTGMLLTGLIYIGALHSVGIQIDQKYLRLTQGQLQQKVEGASYQLIHADAAALKLRRKQFDLVVMNPPFGTKQEGIDIKFLVLAMEICSGPIYSMHKSSTRPFIQKWSEAKGQYRFELIMQVKFPLKKRFKGYHKKEIAFTQVDIIKLIPVKPALTQKNQ